MPGFLFLLSGHEVIRILVKSNKILKKLHAIPNRDPIKIKATVREVL